jgi:predicted HicB family RNase H-like nuclease
VTGNNFALGIRMDGAMKLALERAAAAAGMSVAGFVEAVLARALAKEAAARGELA